MYTVDIPERLKLGTYSCQSSYTPIKDFLILVTKIKIKHAKYTVDAFIHK